MRRTFPPVDFERIQTFPLAERRNKVRREDLIRPLRTGMNLREWMEILPRQLIGESFREFIRRLQEIHRRGGLLVVMFGGHVIKVGLGPLVIQMMEQGVIGAIATNGAGSIHDFELALIGATSEDVAETIQTGRFGMAEETSSLMNQALEKNPSAGMGYLLGKTIQEETFPHRDVSVLAAAYRLGVPATVHVAIGTDIIHPHPTAKGTVLGEATFADFRRFCSVVSQLEGGAILNFGSAVLLPEVFLKALTVARNLGHSVTHFVAADFDMIRHYRPTENVVRRPTHLGGQGFLFTGHHEIMIPLVFACLLETLASD